MTTIFPREHTGHAPCPIKSKKSVSHKKQNNTGYQLPHETSQNIPELWQALRTGERVGKRGGEPNFHWSPFSLHPTGTSACSISGLTGRLHGNPQGRRSHGRLLLSANEVGTWGLSVSVSVSLSLSLSIPAGLTHARTLGRSGMNESSAAQMPSSLISKRTHTERSYRGLGGKATPEGAACSFSSVLMQINNLSVNYIVG